MSKSNKFNYRIAYSTKQTPQNQPIPGRSMVQNRAGGYGFDIGNWNQLTRFLILGTDRPTYYATALEMTVENAETVRRCLAENGKRTVDIIVEMSESGRAPKNDPALFALAMASSPAFANTETRKYALSKLDRVARIGTHLFHFIEYREGFAGWGRLTREAVAAWYTNKSVKDLAFQMVKYQSRDGWSHKDVLRLSHPKTDDDLMNSLFAWATDKDVSDRRLPPLVHAYTMVHRDPNIGVALTLINDYGLTRGMLPTQLLNLPAIWEMLLPDMAYEEMLRNLGKMASLGLTSGFSGAEEMIISKLTNQDIINRSRIHPVAILKAMVVYSKGHGIKGSLSWNVNPRIVDALDAAFYKSFYAVEPTNLRYMIALDISSSMESANVLGMPELTARVASAAMALVTANVEKRHMFVGFSHQLMPLNISPRQRLNDVLRVVDDLPFGYTDCALPMLYAQAHNIPIDAFVIYTDNESWAGNIHPVQALNMYRQKTGIDAKLVAVAMSATRYSVADPNDDGMLDVVGFDTAAPSVISNFAKGF